MRVLPLAAIVGYAFVLSVSLLSCVGGAVTGGAAVRMETASPPTAAPDPGARARRVEAMARTWPAAPDYRVTFHPLGAAPREGSAGGGAVGGAPYDPQDAYRGLPRNGAYADVAAYCSACHTLEIVMQQRASRARWSYMLDWMTKEQNMPPLPQEDRARVLDYLSENFGAGSLP